MVTKKEMMKRTKLVGIELSSDMYAREMKKILKEHMTLNHLCGPNAVLCPDGTIKERVSWRGHDIDEVIAMQPLAIQLESEGWYFRINNGRVYATPQP